MRQMLIRISLMLILLSVAGGNAWALDAIYIVRHAEKAEGWPTTREVSALRPLSEVGVARAEQLATSLGSLNIAAVYASPTTRTLHTGLPLARQTNVPLIADRRTVSADELPSFLNGLNDAHAADHAVLVVGHSNTVPLILKALGASDECYEALGVIEESGTDLIEGYEGIWLVDLAADGCDGLQRFEQSTELIGAPKHPLLR